MAPTNQTLCTETEKHMRGKKIIFLAIALGLILVVTAFGSNGLRDLFNTTIKNARAGAPGGEVASLVVSAGTVGDPSGQPISIVNFTPASELPARPPEAAGLFGSFDGSNLTLQQSFFMTTTDEQGVVLSGSGVISSTGSLDLSMAEPVQAGAIIVSADGNVENLPPVGATDQDQAAFTTVIVGEAVVEGGQTLSDSAQLAQPASGMVTVVGSAVPGQSTPQNVLVTEATQIYHDVTPMEFQPSEGVQTIQQTLEPGSLEGLSGMVMITVWGHLEGEQLVADVIVYQVPPQ